MDQSAMCGVEHTARLRGACWRGLMVPMRDPIVARTLFLGEVWRDVR
jgi:hypothetical protein